MIFRNNEIVLNLSSLLFIHMKVYDCLTIVCFESDVLKTLRSLKTKLVHMMRYIVVELNQFYEEVHLFNSVIFKTKKREEYFMSTMTTHQISNVKKVIYRGWNLNIVKTKV